MHKKKEIYITAKFIAILITVFILFSGTMQVSAGDTGSGSSGGAGGGAGTQTPAPSVTGATPTFKCADVTAAGSSGIFVVLEEPIAVTADANNIFCFRVCKELTETEKTTAATKTEQMKICEIKDKCEGGGAIGDKYSCQRVQVMKADSGTELIYNYVGMIYKWAAATVGIVAVFTMVFSGIMIMSAGGDSAKIDEAKKRITQSLFGLVVLFLSGLILYTINPTFFV
ncbi:hypothetical protein JW911_01835 [Candidatus Peregrinibacteria bacterium]|nr:hypothetical protein [Candidatus Peregrinibacteria bacterium]